MKAPLEKAECIINKFIGINFNLKDHLPNEILSYKEMVFFSVF